MKEKEIDLLDMIADILSRWRGMLIAIVLGAVLLGALSYARSYQNVQNIQSQEAKDTAMDQMAIEERLVQLGKNLDDSQLAAVLTTVDDEREYALKNKYLQGSIYMQLDPLHIAQEELVYNIQEKNENEEQCLGTVYKDIIDSVGLYAWVEQQTGMEASYVGELISVSMNPNLTLNDSGSVTIGKVGSLKIVISGTDMETCGKIAEAVKDYVGQQQEKLNSKLISHELILLSESSGTVVSTDVMKQQADYRNAIYNLETTIATAKKGFTENQKQYYALLMKESGLENTTDIEQNDMEEKKVTTSPTVSKKYIVLGAVLFAFAYVAILGIGYIVNNKIRINDGLQNLYGIPQIGVVVKNSKKKLFLDRWINSLRHYGKREFTAEQSMELALAAVKIAAAKNGLNSICLMGCNLGAGADKVCEDIKTALEKEGISVMILNNVLYDAEAMEKLVTAQGAVLVETIGSTLYNEIVEELELLKRQEIVVLGGITVE